MVGFLKLFSYIEMKCVLQVALKEESCKFSYKNWNDSFFSWSMLIETLIGINVWCKDIDRFNACTCLNVHRVWHERIIKFYCFSEDLECLTADNKSGYWLCLIRIYISKLKTEVKKN